MCSPVKFAHSLSNKSRTVSGWELCTRIILQSMFVNQQMAKRNSNGRIVIKSSDNDVLLLSLHFYSKMTNIDKLWIQTTGTWVQDICFLQFYQWNVHLQRIWTRLICFVVKYTPLWTMPHFPNIFLIQCIYSIFS